MKKTILFAASVFATMSVWAESTVVDGVTWYYETYQEWNPSSQSYETYAMITSGTDKYAGDLTIPSSLGTYPVRKLHHSCFSQCIALRSIVIPKGVSWIDFAAFSGCSGLTAVTIPDGVTTISGQAFDSCTALTNVLIPASVTSVGGAAFRSCRSLARFDIPASATSLGVDFIHNCPSLKVLTVANGNPNYKCVNNCIVTTAGSTLVAVPFGCEEVIIPEGVNSVPQSMFDGCVNLVRVTIPSTVMGIGVRAFCDCMSLSSVCIPEGVVNIGSSAFHNCTSLENVTIPKSVTSINSSAFYNCCSLIGVNIPDGVTSIGADAFSKCYALKGLTIPASVMSVGYHAFEYCSGLVDVKLFGAPPVGIESSCLLSNARNAAFSREYGAQWLAILNGLSKFNGYNRLQPEVSVLSSQIRVDDPTILDVVYQVKSAQPTVKVRVLAFEDGERSFDKVVRPETFVADTNGVETACNVGDAIVPNVPHTLSWRVSSDWSNRLAKVSFEVLATEGELLPFEVRTIPASDAYGKMDVTWNAITENQWFDALLWLYADKNAKMSVADGVCYYDGKMTASGTTLNYNKTASSYYSRTYNSETKKYDYVRYINTPEAVLDAMGYNVLSGDVLNYVNEETRLDLSPSGFRQYGYKIVSEK